MLAMAMKPKVLIAGGGVAGLEAALALRDLTGEKLDLELLCPRREFLYRPYAVGEPFGSAEVQRFDLGRLAEKAGFELNLSSLKSVDADNRRAVIGDDTTADYDHLIVATGVKLLWSIPGATIFWGGPDELDAENVVRELEAGEIERLIFTMPAGRSWSLPLYELALIAGARLPKGGAELIVVTPEEAPLRVFGGEVSEAVGALLEERGIEVFTAAHPVKFEAGQLTIAPGDPIDADAVISLPRMEGRRVEGVPHDDQGFVPTDFHGRVQGLAVKQGGIAGQQADAVAEAIAAEVDPSVDPRPFDPVLRGVLWTGNGHRYLSGRLAPGHGQPAAVDEQAPWSEHDGKIISRYLTRFLAEEGASAAS
jgi:sulfide:quinone oxidoreductase